MWEQMEYIKEAMPLSSIIDAIARLVSTDPDGWRRENEHPSARSPWDWTPSRATGTVAARASKRRNAAQPVELTGRWTAPLEPASDADSMPAGFNIPVQEHGADPRDAAIWLPETMRHAAQAEVSWPSRATENRKKKTEPERPRAKPEFTESLFFELVRSRQWKRAYDLLSPHCQKVWGSIEAFAAYQRAQGLDRIEKMEVKASRLIKDWADPEHGVTYALAAELDASYTFALGGKLQTQTRKIHLVAEQGAWRALCCPSGKAD